MYRTILGSRVGRRGRCHAIALARVTAIATDESTALIAKLVAFGVVAWFGERLRWKTILGVGNDNGEISGCEMP